MADPRELVKLRPMFRRYKRTASRLRDGLPALSGINLEFNLKFERGAATTATFNEHPALIRLAALLRPFMSVGSPIELRSVWRSLTAVEALIDADTQERVSGIFATVDDFGGMALNLNQQELTGRELYFAYAEGEFFAENPEARKLLAQLSFGPMTEMIPFLFHGVCMNYVGLVSAILNVVLEIERLHIRVVLESGSAQCIYCLNREGDFGSEEHVVPEAFGVDDLVLTGAVCLPCNNSLSALDQFLSEFEPLALLRVQNVPLTKKGKFPRADLRDFTIEKVKPRVIRYTSKSRKPVFTAKPQKDGTVAISANIALRRPADIVSLARAVFKIALGVVAFDAGTELACDTRFNAARGFIRGERGMANHFLMLRNPVPSSTIATQWYRESRTVVMVDIFGVRFAVNLEDRPLAIPTSAPKDLVFAFWLGEITKDGVIELCENDCSH